MKTNLIKHIFGVLALMLFGCTAEEFYSLETGMSDDFARVDGDKIVINMVVDAAGLHTVGTRALGTDDYSDMQLYLVEFVDNGSPLINTLRTVYTPDSETLGTDRVVYKVTLDQSDQARILHLIAVPKNEKLTLEYGIESVIIPSLTVTGQKPAYWRRLTFPYGYSQEVEGEVTPTADLEKLRHVALIRNHACVSVTNESSNFTLTGFAIVNNPNSGTVAPWNTKGSSFPEFLNSEQLALGFATLSANYSGVIPSGLTFSNPEAGPVVEDDVAPKYLYERPFNSIRHTYIIIKGRRSGDTEDSYYKLDLGKNDDNGVFRYYSILRNYNYNIVLKSVATKGYSSALKAAQGVVYNNFSFDIELESMLNISDGTEVMYVNFTTAVLTEPEIKTLDFKYRYRNLSASTPTYNNGDVNFIGLTPGDVIKSVVISEVDDAEGWRNVKIECYPAQTETKTQSFTIVKDSGLGRTVNLILHRKWTLTNVKEFAGVLENWNASTPYENIAGPNNGDDLTIFFDVPDNLQEAMFPMTFLLESDRQNIENNPLGMLVVNYGTSGFPSVQGRRIKYEKTVTWTQYNDSLTNDPYDNGTAIKNADGTVTHRVRCRFRTILGLDNLDDDDTQTQVLITNDNFNSALVTFERRTNVIPEL